MVPNTQDVVVLSIEEQAAQTQDTLKEQRSKKRNEIVGSGKSVVDTTALSVGDH